MDQTYFYKHNPLVKNIFLKMLFPTILMNLTTAIASLADTVIIGYFLDDIALSVVTFATPLYMIINTFAALYAVGGPIGMSIDTGKGEKASANRIFSLSVELLFFTGMVILLCGAFLGRQITAWLGAEPDVFDMVYTYSTIVMFGAPIFMLNTGLAFFVRNDGRPNLATTGMFVSIAVDMVTNIIFVGPMQMGVAGAAYSTVLGQLVSVFIIGSHLFSKKCTLRFRFTCNTAAFRIMRNGFSTALHFIYQFFTILLMNHFVVSLAGTGGVVVYTVVFNLYTVSLSLFEGISQTIQPMVSTYYGEKSNHNIKNTMRLAVITTVILCGAVTVLLEIFPQVVPILFGIEDSLLIAQSSLAVRIYAISMIIMTINVVIGYYLQSSEYSLMSAILVSLRCCILFLACAFIFGKMFGMNGIWAAYTVAEIFTFLIFLLMVSIKRKTLEKKGIHADYYLLDKDMEKATDCLTFCSNKDSFANYETAVCSSLAQNEHLSEDVLCNSKSYLSCLKLGLAENKTVHIEVEINGAERKVIIRDDMDHGTLPENIQDALSGESNTEYGPVLGKNRVCLK